MGKIEYAGDRPEVNGEMALRGSLPPWQAPLRPQCVLRDGVLECICGECVPPPQAPQRLEDLPEQVPGWTAQNARNRATDQ